MLMLISPAKTLDFSPLSISYPHSVPDFLQYSAQLVALLRQKAPQDLAQLMGLSDKLALLNYDRYQNWTPDFSSQNAKPAVLAFMGDVYEGLAAAQLTGPQLEYLGQHLRILSGLYGLLRPLDLIQPYRLEMGTALANAQGKDLYAFWGATLVRAIEAAQPNVVVNLASQEYFKAVKALTLPVITPVFEEGRHGRYKVVSFYAKRARGLMVRWAACRGVRDPEALKGFAEEGYAYVASASDATTWRFRRQSG